MSEPNSPSVPPVPTPAAATPDIPVPETESRPAPRFGEFAPIEPAASVESAEPAAPSGVPPAPAAPVPPGYPAGGYPSQPAYPQQQGYPQAASAQPGYAQQPGYPQPVYGQPGFGASAAPKRRTWDVVLTIALLVLGLGGALLGVLYGVMFSSPELLDQGFRQQGFNGFHGEVGAAPLVLVVSHVLLYLLAVGLSILLLVKRKIAFYVPLSAGVLAAIIFWGTLVAVMMSGPAFLPATGY